MSKNPMEMLPNSLKNYKDEARNFQSQWNIRIIAYVLQAVGCSLIEQIFNLYHWDENQK